LTLLLGKTLHHLSLYHSICRCMAWCSAVIASPAHRRPAPAQQQHTRQGA
jgi:hypothetical protein